MHLFRKIWDILSITLNSLRAKISFAFVLFAITMAAASYLLSYREVRTGRNEMRQRMERIAKQIASIRLAETEGQCKHWEQCMWAFRSLI